MRTSLCSDRKRFGRLSLQQVHDRSQVAEGLEVAGAGNGLWMSALMDSDTHENAQNADIHDCLTQNGSV